MASMRAKRARRVAAWPVTKRRQIKFAKGGILPADVRLYGREGPGLEYAGAAREIQLKRRPWLQRFIRSYRGWRQHLGIVQSLRAAWRISRIAGPTMQAGAGPEPRPGRDWRNVSGGQLLEG